MSAGEVGSVHSAPLGRRGLLCQPPTHATCRAAYNLIQRTVLQHVLTSAPPTAAAARPTREQSEVHACGRAACVAAHRTLCILMMAHLVAFLPLHHWGRAVGRATDTCSRSCRIDASSASHSLRHSADRERAAALYIARADAAMHRTDPSVRAMHWRLRRIDQCGGRAPSISRRARSSVRWHAASFSSYCAHCAQ